MTSYTTTTTGPDRIVQRAIEHDGTPHDRKQISRMVDDWIAQNGARRFERGASGEYANIKLFLADRGWIITGSGQARIFLIKREGQPGRGSRHTWHSVLRFVDQLRVEGGLEPLKRRAA